MGQRRLSWQLLMCELTNNALAPACRTLLLETLCLAELAQPQPPGEGGLHHSSLPTLQLELSLPTASWPHPTTVGQGTEPQGASALLWDSKQTSPPWSFTARSRGFQAHNSSELCTCTPGFLAVL